MFRKKTKFEIRALTPEVEVSINQMNSEELHFSEECLLPAALLPNALNYDPVSALGGRVGDDWDLDEYKKGL